MKTRLLLLIIAVLISGCGALGAEPRVIVVTATPEPTRVMTSTPTPRPPTRTPTITPLPSATPLPTEPPVDVEDVRAALRADGYKRFPFVNQDGVNGFYWVKGNGWERILTWEDGSLRLEVIDDKSARVRDTHMEVKLGLLDTIFSPTFMDDLRRQHQAYNGIVGPSVSGQPSYMEPADPNDPWAYKIGEYNVKDTTIGSLHVRFALWWWQVTCPPQYLYCYMTDFPGTNFTGQASITLYTITIDLNPSGGGGGGGSV
jgi:hypothetical protein